MWSPDEPDLTDVIVVALSAIRAIDPRYLLSFPIMHASLVHMLSTRSGMA